MIAWSELIDTPGRQEAPIIVGLLIDEAKRDLAPGDYEAVVCRSIRLSLEILLAGAAPCQNALQLHLGKSKDELYRAPVSTTAQALVSAPRPPRKATSSPLS